jgi:hypothetical protein
MERQTQIPAPQGGMQPRSWWCEWCGKQAFERIEIEPARWGQVNGQRTLVRRYVYVEGEMTFPDRHKRDQGNFRFIVEKALGDALQQAGVIADDDWDSYEFGGLSKTYEKGVSRTRLLLMADWT